MKCKCIKYNWPKSGTTTASNKIYWRVHSHVQATLSVWKSNSNLKVDVTKKNTLWKCAIKREILQFLQGV